MKNGLMSVHGAHELDPRARAGVRTLDLVDAPLRDHPEDVDPPAFLLGSCRLVADDPFGLADDDAANLFDLVDVGDRIGEAVEQTVADLQPNPRVAHHVEVP